MTLTVKCTNDGAGEGTCVHSSVPVAACENKRQRLGGESGTDTEVCSVVVETHDASQVGRGDDRRPSPQSCQRADDEAASAAPCMQPRVCVAGRNHGQQQQYQHQHHQRCKHGALRRDISQSVLKNTMAATSRISRRRRHSTLRRAHDDHTALHAQRQVHHDDAIDGGSGSRGHVPRRRSTRSRSPPREWPSSRSRRKACRASLRTRARTAPCS
jgi:hypothetical protein